MTPIRAAVPTTLALCLLLSLGACASTNPQGAADAGAAVAAAQTGASEEVIEVEIAWHGRVTGLDAGDRLVSVRGDDGQERTFQVDKEVERLEDIQVGDHVQVYFQRSLVFDMQPAGSVEPGAYIWQDESHPDSGRPGVVEQEVVTVLSPLVAVDTRAHTISVQAPNGTVHVLDVEQPHHREALSRLNVGDLLRIQFRRLLAVRITPED